ncbi:HAD family hydrolase [Magnetospirillum sp. UT-4]|uniref:HAD family hydrolase n=1 Tax=Magnetospirillum sp. UT-4 TaxID=2681467 RepID=UPI001384F214|nr:HAD family hydrolase [Magnetospirillum sp. UT-4]CAA7617902.1 Predicted phosphatase [Magnetospirillum sp. UT-4]
MPDATRPSAILFDWDNTLVDSWVCIREAYNITFRHFGMPEWSMAETRANVAKSMRDSFPQMFGERWTEARDVFYQGFESIHLSHLRELPGAGAMLADLAERRIFLAVVSNKRGAFLRKEAEALGWSGLFGALVGAADAAADKPAVDPVHLALERAGVAAGPAVWFVGDAAIDMHCAANAGCVGIVMRSDPPLEEEFATYPPAYTLGDCRALVTLVDELSVPISAN